MGKAGSDVVALESLEAIVEAEGQCIFAELPIGTKMAFDLRPITPPSEVCKAGMIAYIYFIIGLAVGRAEKTSESGNFYAFADGKTFATEFYLIVFCCCSKRSPGPHKGLRRVVAIAWEIKHSAVGSYGSSC